MKNGLHTPLSDCKARRRAEISPSSNCKTRRKILARPPILSFAKRRCRKPLKASRNTTGIWHTKSRNIPSPSNHKARKRILARPPSLSLRIAGAEPLKNIRKHGVYPACARLAPPSSCFPFPRGLSSPVRPFFARVPTPPRFFFPSARSAPHTRPSVCACISLSARIAFPRHVRIPHTPLPPFALCASRHVPSYFRTHFVSSCAPSLPHPHCSCVLPSSGRIPSFLHTAWKSVPNLLFSRLRVPPAKQKRSCGGAN